MKVRQLIERLEDFDPDQEVQIVHQPSWPLRERLAGLWEQESRPVEVLERMADRAEAYAQVGNLDAAQELEHEIEALNPDGEYAGVVFLVAGGHPDEGSPYGPKEAFEGRW